MNLPFQKVQTRKQMCKLGCLVRSIALKALIKKPEKTAVFETRCLGRIIRRDPFRAKGRLQEENGANFRRARRHDWQNTVLLRSIWKRDLQPTQMIRGALPFALFVIAEDAAALDIGV